MWGTKKREIRLLLLFGRVCGAHLHKNATEATFTPSLRNKNDPRLHQLRKGLTVKCFSDSLTQLLSLKDGSVNARCSRT